MLAQFPLFDRVFLDSLLAEFRATMRALLLDLCRDLAALARTALLARRFPISYFRSLARALKPEEFSHWRVVGLIEGLNDLVYFLDAAEQLRADRDAQGFAESFFAACVEQFYENSYLDELFPAGAPDHRGLKRRLGALCERLNDQVIGEALFLVPGLASQSSEEGGRRKWNVRMSLGPDFECGDPAMAIPWGLDGRWLSPRLATRRALTGARYGTIELSKNEVHLSVGGLRVPVCREHRYDDRYWHIRTAAIIVAGRQAAVTLGPTVVYDRHRVPARVVPSPPALSRRMRRAVEVIERAWPEGASNFFALTTHLVPIKARGVVSYSYRHRPGLSFINCFDRNRLDLIDDLIHENSHHHLNLLLRKAVLLRGDHNQEIFYSPWRRSLRPLRGILHATFTFTMGAILFERLSSHADRLTDLLSPAEILRARARCREEIASVQYSLEDLDRAAARKWLTRSGVRLVDELKGHIEKTEKRIAPYEAEVSRSRYGAALRRHRDELARAAKLYRWRS